MFPQAVLIVWIVASIVLFAVLSPLRAFLLTYIIGILFLPVEYRDQGVIIITQSLRLEKFVACNLGALIGTLCFAPHIFKRYRFHWVDAVFAIVIIGEFLSSVVNDLGAKNGLSVAMEIVRDYLPIIVLSRLYLASVSDVYQALRAVIGGALVYSVICVYEWRFSPQLHTDTYGYFQHSFVQFMRGGHFRPAGYLRHAIEVSTFMGLSTALAAWLWYKNLFKPLWGIVPIWMILPLLAIGMLATNTVSGEGAMLMSVCLLGLIAFTHNRWILWVLPLASILWMVGRYAQAIDRPFLLQVAGNFVDSDRLVSLDYRLKAERLNLEGVKNNLPLGKGPQNAFARDDNGKIISIAIDAWWILQITFFGINGIVGWYLIWCACIYETFTRWRNLTPDLQTVAAAICILIGAQFVDFLFNAFPSMFLLMLDVGIISALQRYKPVKVARGAVVAADAHAPVPPEMVLP